MFITLRFGRYTVAALEAKIHQYERDVAQLKRALERSDKYIEELEAQNQRDSPKSEEGVCSNAASGGTQNGGIERISLIRRSLSEMEETSVCTDLDQKCSELPNNDGHLLTTSDVCQRVGFLGGTLTPQNDGLKDVTVPSTPSSALRSLSLKSPAAVCSDRKLGLKPLTYLRRLSFDDCQGPTSSSSVNQSQGPSKSTMVLLLVRKPLWVWTKTSCVEAGWTADLIFPVWMKMERSSSAPRTLWVTVKLVWMRRTWTRSLSWTLWWLKVRAPAVRSLAFLWHHLHHHHHHHLHHNLQTLMPPKYQHWISVATSWLILEQQESTKPHLWLRRPPIVMLLRLLRKRLQLLRSVTELELWWKIPHSPPSASVPQDCPSPVHRNSQN